MSIENPHLAPRTNSELSELSNEAQQLIAYTKHEQILSSPEAITALGDLDDIGASKDVDPAVATEIINTIGVFAGVKPTAIIDRSVIDTLSDDGIIDPYSNAVANIGLTAIPFDSDSGARLLAVSRHRQLAELARDAFWSNSDEEEPNYRRGALLGYPASATAHYLARIAQYNATGIFPAHVYSSSNQQFSQLILSPDHHEQESQIYCMPLEEAVKQMTPNTYNKIIAPRRAGVMTRTLVKMRAQKSSTE